MAKSQLYVLENKLKKIRRYRKTSIFLAVLLSFVVFSSIMSYWFNPFLGLVWFFTTFASTIILERYYNMKEKQVRREIEKLRLWKGYGEH